MKRAAKVDISVSAGIIKSLAFLGACQTGVNGLFPSPTVPRSHSLGLQEHQQVASLGQCEELGFSSTTTGDPISH